ncbi:MAG: HEAT repeat domain-containing protein [Cyclobacteriaceae bacterium]
MKITDEIAITWWADRLEGNLDDEKSSLLDEYLSENTALKIELEQSRELWSKMEMLQSPEPSQTMDQRFEAMLQGYGSAKEHRSSSLWDMIQTWITSNWQAAAPALIVGVIIGFFLLPKQAGEVKELTSEVQDMKKMLMLSMIEKPQAQDRIMAVNMVSEIPKADEKITASLVSTLNNDPSMNVRLAALDALMHYAKHESVRAALIKSINLQTSPLLQVALADAMIALQEKSAVESFSHLLDSAQVDESVKSKLESTIKTLKEI